LEKKTDIYRYIGIENMVLENEVVQLSEADELNIIEILSKAFQETPQIPALIEKPKHTKTMIINLIELYKKTGTIKTFGIKKDGRLVCIGLCIDSNAKPTSFQTIKFGLSILKILGIKGLHQFWIYNKNKPNYDKKCLELILYGTQSNYQKKCYGRQMLNFLYDYAKKNNYGGVTGVTNSSRPAFKFYMKDGWIVDKEFLIGKYKICWVRKKV
jgi:hypothetical protein